MFIETSRDSDGIGNTKVNSIDEMPALGTAYDHGMHLPIYVLQHFGNL